MRDLVEVYIATRLKWNFLSDTSGTGVQFKFERHQSAETTSKEILQKFKYLRLIVYREDEDTL